MVKGPGTVILMTRSVCSRRNRTSANPDRARPTDRAHHSWHWVGVTTAVQRLPGVVQVEPDQRRGEMVRVALPTDLAVTDDVQAGGLLLANRQPGGVVLGLGQMLRGGPP